MSESSGLPAPALPHPPMTTPRSLLVLLLLGSAPVLRAGEPDKVDQAKAALATAAHDVAAATERAATATEAAARKLYAQTAREARRAAAVTKEKSQEAYATAREATAAAAAKLTEEARAAGKTIAEKSTVAAAAAEDKARELITTKDELARFDRNHDGKLDAGERAQRAAEQKK